MRVLTTVVRQGSSEVGSVLVKVGYPALGWLLKAAIFYHQVEFAKLLLDAGADVSDNNATKHFEHRCQAAPLHLAVFNGDIGLMELLLDAGADIEGHDEDGRNPISHAISFHGHPFPFNNGFRKSSSGSREASEFLLTCGANVNLAGSLSMDFILVACMENFMVDTFVARGAYVRAVDMDQWTPLHVAAQHRHGAEGPIDTLLETGADVAAADNFGCTALCYGVVKET